MIYTIAAIKLRRYSWKKYYNYKESKRINEKLNSYSLFEYPTESHRPSFDSMHESFMRSPSKMSTRAVVCTEIKQYIHLKCKKEKSTCYIPNILQGISKFREEDSVTVNRIIDILNFQFEETKNVLEASTPESVKQSYISYEPGLLSLITQGSLTFLECSCPKSIKNFSLPINEENMCELNETGEKIFKNLYILLRSKGTDYKEIKNYLNKISTNPTYNELAFYIEKMLANNYNAHASDIKNILAQYNLEGKEKLFNDSYKELIFSLILKFCVQVNPAFISNHYDYVWYYLSLVSFENYDPYTDRCLSLIDLQNRIKFDGNNEDSSYLEVFELYLLVAMYDEALKYAEIHKLFSENVLTHIALCLREYGLLITSDEEIGMNDTIRTLYSDKINQRIDLFVNKYLSGNPEEAAYYYGFMEESDLISYFSSYLLKQKMTEKFYSSMLHINQEQSCFFTESRLSSIYSAVIEKASADNIENAIILAKNLRCDGKGLELIVNEQCAYIERNLFVFSELKKSGVSLKYADFIKKIKKEQHLQIVKSIHMIEKIINILTLLYEKQESHALRECKSLGLIPFDKFIDAESTRKIFDSFPLSGKRVLMEYAYILLKVVEKNNILRYSPK